MSLAPLQVDALRELCNICCGQAANALSRLLGDVRVGMDLPEVERTRLEEMAGLLGEVGANVVVAQLPLEGPVQGHLLLALDESDAAELAGRLLGGEPSRAPFSDAAASALCETANILASACVSALFGLTRLTVVPGVPQFTHDVAAEVVEELRLDMGRPGEEVLVLSARLIAGDATVHGRILVVPRDESVPHLLAAMGVA